MEKTNTCPSFFSRLYETNNAFREVGMQIRSNGLLSFDGNNRYYDLVSKCLDLLELIFLYGESSHLSTEMLYINNWLGGDEYERMIISDYHFDKRLEKCPCWLLFYWDDQILGGLSPYTSVYTTPGIDASSMNMMGTNGNLLFGEEGVSLLKRGTAFQRYLIASIYYAPNDTYSSEFKEYFYLCQRYLDERTKMEILETGSDYLHTIGKPFPNEMCRNLFVANNAHGSDYQIKATKKLPADDSPLLLTSEGLQGAIYWREMPWNPSQMKVGGNLNPDITRRELPGTADTYPYLTTNDLLEDKIVELSGITSPDMNHFSFLHVDGRLFLIPVKPLFFEYYTSSDLVHQISIENKDDVIEVKLFIPLSSFKYKYDTITKQYSKDDIVVFEDFFFAMTPHMVQQTASNQKNTCKLICSHPLNLMDSFDSTDTIIFNVVKQENGYVIGETDSSPDVLEFLGGTVSGIIVVCQDRYTSYPTNIVFSVDCTTNNVTIAYSVDNGFPKILEEAEVMNTILAFDQAWKNNVTTEILRMIRNEFMPLYEMTSLSMFNFAYENYCQRLAWMMKNIAITKAGTDKLHIVVVHDNFMSRSQCDSLKESWERSFSTFGNENNKVDLVSSSCALYSYLRRGGWDIYRSITCVELGEKKSSISYCYSDSSDNIFTKQALFSTAYFWGIHNDYILTSDFVTETLSRYNNIDEQINGFSKNKMNRTEKMSEAPFRFLMWLVKRDEDKSHFWEYIRKDEQVRLKAFVYYVSILFYIDLLAKNKKKQLSGKLFFCGSGAEILRLLGSDDVLSKFSSFFLSEITGSPVEIRLIVVSSSDYKALGGLDYNFDHDYYSFNLKTRVCCEDEICYEDVMSMKDRSVGSVQKLLDVLTNKHLSRRIYDFFRIRTDNLTIINSLAADSFDYHIKDIFEGKDIISPRIIQEDLFLVSLMDYFSSPQKDNEYYLEKKPSKELEETNIFEKNGEKRIFISYKREELNLVKEIKDAIEKKTGYKCWMDLEGIESGAMFKRVIIKAINNTNIFLFMLSKKSQESKFALKELSFAKNKEDRQKKRFVVLVNIDGCEMNDDFSFDFGDLDIILYSSRTQREKLFHDIKTWLDSI